MTSVSKSLGSRNLCRDVFYLRVFERANRVPQGKLQVNGLLLTQTAAMTAEALLVAVVFARDELEVTDDVLKIQVIHLVQSMQRLCLYYP